MVRKVGKYLARKWDANIRQIGILKSTRMCWRNGRNKQDEAEKKG